MALFAGNRTRRNRREQDLVPLPARRRGRGGPRPPRIDPRGRVYARLDRASLRPVLVPVHPRLKRHQARAEGDDLQVAAVAGHEFFPSRTRCGAPCQPRTRKGKGEEGVADSHPGLVCHRSEHPVAVPRDVERLRPGDGEETAAQRLVERVFANEPRSCDGIRGDALSCDAPLLTCCREPGQHALVVLTGAPRRRRPDAPGLLAPQPPPLGQDRRRTLRCWDAEGFSPAAGVKQPLRVVPTVATVRRRQRVAGPWQEQEETAVWYGAPTRTRRHLSTRRVGQAGHGRGDEDNDGFNPWARPWGLDHGLQHDPAASVPCVLTRFLA